MSIDKASFRKLCSKRLQASSAQGSISKSHKVNRVLKQLLSDLDPQSILFYLPLGFEVDTRQLLNYQKRKIRKTYVPFMVGESFKMVPYRMPLTQGNFGVSEPNTTLLNIEKVDVAIVPVVGVDTDSRRIGFGKGMYDRFFSRLTNKPIIIFVQIEECICEQKVTDYYDIQADIYITPKTIKYRKPNVKPDSLRRWDRYRQRSNRIFDLQKIKQRAI